MVIQTARRWLHYLGFKPKVQIKGYYTDGHNRPDVLNYRDNVFLPQMEIYERRMRQYDGPDMTDMKEPTLDL